MSECTKKRPCPECGLPVRRPLREDLPYEERLCMGCLKEMEIHEEVHEEIARRKAKNNS